MAPKIEIDPDKVAAFCRKWKIEEFALFGSVLREDFGPLSDVDVLVTFVQDADWDLWHLIEMRDELKGIFGRGVDLVEEAALRNPFRRRAIVGSKEVVYAA